MIKVCSLRSGRVLWAMLVAMPVIVAGGCAQAPDADLEKRLADADARTAAAEKRIAAATHAGGGSAIASGPPAQTQAIQPVDNNAALDSANGVSEDTKYQPYRDARSGPNKDVP